MYLSVYDLNPSFFVFHNTDTFYLLPSYPSFDPLYETHNGFFHRNTEHLDTCECGSIFRLYHTW